MKSDRIESLSGWLGEAIGDTLNRVRSKPRLADALGIARQTIYAWEAEPPRDAAPRLAEALHRIGKPELVAFFVSRLMGLDDLGYEVREAKHVESGDAPDLLVRALGTAGDFVARAAAAVADRVVTEEERRALGPTVDKLIAELKRIRAELALEDR